MAFQQHNPTHPGELILRTYIEPFETESWLRLQESYDLWQARQAIDTKNLKRIDFSQVA